MLFNEVTASPWKPFQDYVSVQRAKELGFIPEEYWDVFVNTCGCGSERMARLADGAVTGITCCDPYCQIKLAYQLASVFERFGHKGVGIAICSKVVGFFIQTGKPFGLHDVLTRGLDVAELGNDEARRWEMGINTIKNSRQTFGALMYKWSFPGIGSKYIDVMRGITTMSDLSIAIREEGFTSFFSKRGIKSMTSLYYLLCYLPEIDKLATTFKDGIVVSHSRILPVCLTGQMWNSLGRSTKKEFLDLCSQYLEARELNAPFEISSVETVSKATFIVVGVDAIEKRTAKYKNALVKQQELRAQTNDPEYKVIYSPDEFLQLILGKGDVNG